MLNHGRRTLSTFWAFPSVNSLKQKCSCNRPEISLYLSAEIFYFLTSSTFISGGSINRKKNESLKRLIEKLIVNFRSPNHSVPLMCLIKWSSDLLLQTLSLLHSVNWGHSYWWAFTFTLLLYFKKYTKEYTFYTYYALYYTSKMSLHH